MLKERMEGLIPQEEAFVIVKSMQSQEESTEIAQRLQAKLEGCVVVHRGELRTDREVLSHPNALPFDEFMETVLGVHLKAHEAKIAEVVAAFRKVDRDAKGFLDEEQFRRFCHSLGAGISDGELDTLLDVIDPQSTGRVTFSSCAASLVPHA